MKEAEITEGLPVCQKNGNFEGRQTKGLIAYCVDENGNQFPGTSKPITDNLVCDNP